MKPESNINNTAGAVAQERLVCLLSRFRKISASKRKVAKNWKRLKMLDCARHNDRLADQMERCADELSRTLKGETPPNNPWKWDVSETNAEPIHGEKDA